MADRPSGFHVRKPAFDAFDDGQFAVNVGFHRPAARKDRLRRVPSASLPSFALICGSSRIVIVVLVVISSPSKRVYI